MTGEVPDAAAVAKRDRHDLGLHRIAEAAMIGPSRRESDRLEVHAAAHPDVARPPEHDRGFRCFGMERVSAH